MTLLSNRRCKHSWWRLAGFFPVLLSFLVPGSLPVVSAGSLGIDDGVVVKFGPAAGMTVREHLQTSRHVVMTSVKDDAAANQTGTSPGIPAPGDWRGLTILDSVSPQGDLRIDRLELRYAGAGGAAALQVARDYAVQFLRITDSLLGLRVTEGAKPNFSDISLAANGVGLEAREEASPTLVRADIAGNTDFGVLNLSPQTIARATGAWWGAPTGPTAADNAGGTGDRVSAGVDYGRFSAVVPLIACSLAAADGLETVGVPRVRLALECRNAVEYRIALDGDFGAAPFRALDGDVVEFPLSGGAGDRTIVVQYRAATLNTASAQLVVHYQPDAPVVTIGSPAPGAVVATDTTIVAEVSDAAGVDHVDFLVDSTLLGSDAAAPYEMTWPIAGFAPGDRTIRVVATSTSGRTGQASLTVHLQQPAEPDTEGPSIGEVRFDGVPAAGGTIVLPASGTLSIALSDPSGIGGVSVSLDGSVLPGGTLEDDGYAVYVDLDGVAEGAHTLVIDAVDTLGNPSEVILDAQVQASGGPSAPAVAFTAPSPEQPVVADTRVAATVAGTNVRRVDFYLDDSPLGSDATEPYEWVWQIGGVTDGEHLLKAVAIDAGGRSGQDTLAVTVRHPSSDATGPSITDARIDGEPLVEGMRLSASGTLGFRVADVSGVSSARATWDGAALPGGALAGAAYSVPLDLTGAADGDHSIALQATDALGNGSERVVHVVVGTSPPPAPVVTITSPADGARLSADTAIAATVAGTDVRRVDFYAGTTWIGGAAAPPYQALWQVSGFPNGAYDLQAIAANGDNRTGSDTVHVTLQRASDDTAGPTIADVRFAGQPLADGATLTQPGLLTFRASDPSGVASAAVAIGATPVSGGGFNDGVYSTLLDFEAVPNGSYDLVLSAVDTVGNASAPSAHPVVVAVPPPPPPVLLAPADATTTLQPSVAVSGTAQAGSQVQLLLNGSASGAPVPVNFNGTFNRTLALPAEGAYSLSATATSSRGTSAVSAPVGITYSAPVPSVVITSPSGGALIESDGPVTVEASVVDAVGIGSVTLKVDGHDVGDGLSAPPYSWNWTVDAGVAEGDHDLVVEAVNAVGKSATASRTVHVAHAPPPPPPVQTAYTGRVDAISPATSYGEAVTIGGMAIASTSGQPVPNALLKIVLRVNGFQRRIGVSTDANGAFSYRFVPQNSDAGVYVVSVIHPDQTDLPEQGRFTVDRLALDPSQYALRAARTIAETIPVRVSASAGEGANGVSLAAVPADQPSGALPPGIDVTASEAVDLAPGHSATLHVGFRAGDQTQAPAASGTVVLTAKDGGGRSRGQVVVNYTLSDPQASLFPQPTGVQTGVARGRQAVESVQLVNRGLAPATGVHVELAGFVDPNGNPGPVPAWIYLASPADLGDMGVGASRAVQIVAAPAEGVGDGIYRLSLHAASAENAIDVAVAVAVTSADAGGVLLHAKDIYTCSPDDPDCAPKGLEGAYVSVQNEQVYTLTRSGTTGAAGELQIDGLPAGHYRYVANAPNHVSTTGRFTVRPGVTVLQDVFLDYELVSFEWSVTETTIVDHYDVTLTATYQTQVPAPVMLIEPASINLPDLQVGEEFAGEVTITNYGLVRADNVVWHPATSDEYFDVEYMGVPPDTFDAHQVFHLPYRITKKRTPLPGTESAQTSATAQPGPLFRSVKSGAATTSGTCRTYANQMHVAYGYQCASGDQRSGSAWSGFNKAYGQQCGGSGSVGGGSGGAGGWIGGGGGGAGGTAMSSGPGCVPVCPDCNGGHSGG